MKSLLIISILYFSSNRRILFFFIAPNDGQEPNEGEFPGLVDWITLLEGESLDNTDYSVFVDVLKVHYRSLLHAISNAIKIIDEVHLL